LNIGCQVNKEINDVWYTKTLLQLILILSASPDKNLSREFKYDSIKGPGVRSGTDTAQN